LAYLRHKLASTLIHIGTELCHQRVRKPELRDRKSGNSELT
jgi:hypothetical protein